MITHIALSGGGIKGMAYLGILRYLYIENMINDIKYASGTSIGALYCLYIALKTPIDFLENEYMNLLKELNDINYLSINKSSFCKLLETNGFVSVEFMTRPAKKYLKQLYDNEDITFIELAKRTGVNIYVNTTCINNGQRTIFSLEHTPDISVIDAIKASMSVPIMFEPVYIDGEYHVDGILSMDLPVDVFGNTNPNNILAVLLSQSDNLQSRIYPKDTDFNFMNYIIICMQIMALNSMHQSVKEFDNYNAPYLLKLDDLPYNDAFKFDIREDDIKVKLEQKDIDNLILKGFIHMSNYMKKRNEKTKET
jgi:predicted acylesterase/phospholipase RssA